MDPDSFTNPLIKPSCNISTSVETKVGETWKLRFLGSSLPTYSSPGDLQLQHDQHLALVVHHLVLHVVPADVPMGALAMDTLGEVWKDNSNEDDEAESTNTNKLVLKGTS